MTKKQIVKKSKFKLVNFVNDSITLDNSFNPSSLI